MLENVENSLEQSTIIRGETAQETTDKTRLTSSELANIWSSFIMNSKQMIILEYLSKRTEDVEIRSILEHSFNASKKQSDKALAIFQKEQHPVPQGFTEKDANLDAPKLFTDELSLRYLEKLLEIRIDGYSTAILTSARDDIRNFIVDCLNSSLELYNKTISVLVSKGFYLRSPFIAVSDEVDFAKKQNYLTGFLGKRRPMDSIEVSHVFFNIKTNSLKAALFTGYSQVVQSPQVRDYILRGKDILQKHIKILSSDLLENELPVSMNWDSGVLDASVPPFSDKLIMNHIRVLNSVDMSNYGKSISVTMRHDLLVEFARLFTELGKYSEDGVNILIDNGWLEESPHLAADKKDKKFH